MTAFERLPQWVQEEVKKPKRPQAVAVTLDEGGDFYKTTKGRPGFNHVHCIVFDDGSVWDALNGWRD
jgi:hypothetical protein